MIGLISLSIKTNIWVESSGNISEARKKRRIRYGSYEKHDQIPSRVWIDERPTQVAKRLRLVDWGADTIISQGK